MNRQKGFSLIEAIIAVSIIGVIGLVMADLLSRGFRGSNKTQLTGVIKQNGQSALNIIDQTIRQAETVICPTIGNLEAKKLVIRTIDGNYVRFSIVDETSTANGYIAVDNPIRVIGSGFDPTTPNVLCTTGLGTPATGLSYLTDFRNSVSGTSVKSGGFTKLNPEPGAKDAISVQFTLGAAVGSGTNFEDRLQTNVNFSTTVQVR